MQIHSRLTLSYIEAQMHGGVGAADIEKVFFSKEKNEINNVSFKEIKAKLDPKRHSIQGNLTWT